MNALLDQGPLAVFFALAIVHALADFPLQTTYMVEQKSRQRAESRAHWLITLCAHSLIHAGGVWLITGSMWMAAAELVLHGLIDTFKSEKKYGLLTDQTLHLLCKLAYALIICS